MRIENKTRADFTMTITSGKQEVTHQIPSSGKITWLAPTHGTQRDPKFNTLDDQSRPHFTHFKLTRIVEGRLLPGHITDTVVLEGEVSNAHFEAHIILEDKPTAVQNTVTKVIKFLDVKIDDLTDVRMSTSMSTFPEREFDYDF